MQIFKVFQESAKETRRLHALVITALLVALHFIISGFEIYLTPQIRIGFSFLTIAVVGLLFGPVLAMTAGGLSDIISFLLNPAGTYFPGFTVSAILGGLIYGLFFYKKPVTLWRILCAKFLVSLLINLGLNTFWHTILYGKSFVVLFPARALKNLILLPIEMLLLFFVLKTIRQIYLSMEKGLGT